jgi:very-short-patch-repair endonuclease
MRVTPEYKVEIARRLRREQTPSEAKLWAALRRNHLEGLGFRRQHPIGRFVADFCCEQAKPVVEVDGQYHEATEQKEADWERAAHFTGRGYTVLRVTADAVMAHLEWVFGQISAAAHRDLSAEPSVIFAPTPDAPASQSGPSRNGEGCQEGGEGAASA